MAAGTFVYVSNAADGDISTYRLEASGDLRAGPRVKAAPVVMPMAVSPDRRFLYAATRAKPYTVFAYAIDRETGALKPVDSAPLAESMPYISLDRAGRFLLAASYGAHLASVNAVAADGRVSPKPVQVVPTGRNAHSIGVDRTNRFVFVPNLGSDQVMQFTFDEASGRLASNTPAAALVDEGTGPRHFVTSSDNRFLYVLGEFTAKVIVFSLDAASGLLTRIGEATGLPADSGLRPGAARGPVVAGGTVPPPDTGKDIWAADIHMTPDGRFLYISERTGDTLAGFGVNQETGLLAYLGSAPTERQPRGFAIDASGRFLVASGEESDTVSVHSIDRESGALGQLGRYPGGKGANWVEIVSFD
ncbi:lactonase family protein [Shumkonia mesophila]|uniref:lactonase family protein n=1 Tax=Shumkonia mesophila TaxID=2838854 RepID=UPI002934C96E|nr:beta-propeller fold lactonase family protein [Shumkonia mesophila]